MLESLKSLFARRRRLASPAVHRRPQLETLEARLAPAASLPPAPVSVGHALVQTAEAPRVLQSFVSLNANAMRLQFSQPLGAVAAKPSTYHIPGLTIRKVGMTPDCRTVILITSPQVRPSYTLQLRGLFLKSGKPVSTAANTATVYPPSAYKTDDMSPARVTGAGSTGNTTVLVSFSRGMGNSALNPSSYVITQVNVNPEAGALKVLRAEFHGSRRVVKLTTDSQSELVYNVTVYNVRDLLGRPLPAIEVVRGVPVDPTKSTFPGTPPTHRIDSDGDGLTDNEEQRGWQVRFKLIDGTFASRGVTSDPRVADTDGDGLPDAQEATLRLDPRDGDSDDDQLTDNQEFNEIYSDATSQDTDGDGLDDGLEFNFFRTSPVHADTDGDQLPDGDEVLLANRNARVADLPTPAIEVGEIGLRLDVRFTETTATQSRELESKTVRSTLTQSESKKHSNMNSNTQEAYSKLTVETGFEVKGTAFGGAEWGVKVTGESGWTGTWVTQHTEESERGTQRAYEESRQADVEATEGATVQREVAGAQLQVTVFVKNASTLAYRLKNLQLTAFLQDPRDPTRLTPVATLLPDAEPADGFTLGPLVPERGPFIFSNTTVFPALVESLMQNPRGLVFKIANFDIADELGRNFAFTSKDITDRTGSVVIDFGGFDSDNDGEGDLTEYHRVATNAGRVIDTNGDGRTDGSDRRVVFDANGRQVGITLREALAAIGLTWYDEASTPTASLTAEQRRNSYSTLITPEGLERVFRVRDVAIEDGVPKSWEILTPTGIDRTVGLDDLVVRPDSDVKLAFVQDLDGDRLPASLEFLLGSSDILADTDADGLDDRFEALIGWKVDLAGQGARPVFSSGTLADSDGDGLTDADEAPGNLVHDEDGLIERAERAGPGDFVTDPLSPDTDRDGLGDASEVAGYTVQLRGGGSVTVKTDPANFDTDGDTAPDGLEARLGGNPTDPGDRDLFADDDGDGLANVEETDGWRVNVFEVSDTAFREGRFARYFLSSDPRKADTDGDGLLDGRERQLGTDPTSPDTDRDGLTDKEEVGGLLLRHLEDIVVVLDPTDADTDDDKLADGAEAELEDLEANRWVVGVYAQAPYQVSSDPRYADADFDGLADGDERARKSDPTKADTDGDGRDDAREFASGTNPLRPDFRVTVVFASIYIDDDADVDGDHGGEGEFTFELGVRKPDDGDPLGLSAFQPVVTDRLLNTYRPDSDGYEDGGYDIGSDESAILFANHLPSGLPSITFGLNQDDWFTIEGVVREVDLPNPAKDDGGRLVYVNLGGLGGLKVDVAGTEQAGLFLGSKLTSGISELKLGWLGDETEGPVNDDNQIQGEVRGYLVVD